MSANAQTATKLSEIKNPAPREVGMPSVLPGFGSLQSFELLQRTARVLSNSTMVPAQYRAVTEKKGQGGEIMRIENPSALSNCIVALNMAIRMNADPLMVMQNLYVVEGRPAWSSQWVIAQINNCGRFSPIRFDIRDLGDQTVEYEVGEWIDGKKKFRRVSTVVKNRECFAWVVEKETGEKLFGPVVSMEMAVQEGWYQKTGSKWQTMPEVMLRYRAASFLGKLYAPELLMGLMSVEEAGDVYEAEKGTDGGYSVPVESLRTAPVAQAEPVALEHLESMEIPQQTATASPAMATVNATAKSTPRARVSME